MNQYSEVVPRCEHFEKIKTFLQQQDYVVSVADSCSKRKDKGKDWGLYSAFVKSPCQFFCETVSFFAPLP